MTTPARTRTCRHAEGAGCLRPGCPTSALRLPAPAEARSLTRLIGTLAVVVLGLVLLTALSYPVRVAALAAVLGVACTTVLLGGRDAGRER